MTLTQKQAELEKEIKNSPNKSDKKVFEIEKQHKSLVNKQVQTGSDTNIQKAISEFKEIIDELTKKKYYVHLVDECDCCMKGLVNLLIIKQKLEKL
jgi:hypothetical protein